MAKNDSLLGKKFAGYQLEALLGQGGMARVYRGLNLGLKRYEAIKVIDTQFRDDSEYGRRFELEAQAIAQLSHPHIVTVFQTGHVGNVLYMAMQYIDGSDVAEVLESYEANDEFINPNEALKILREAGSALDYVHQRGIIHRDVKPSNIMLDENGRAILTDFGLALMTEIGTRGEIFGTPHYLSPEQAISSAAVVPQSDIYSLGVIAYRMFTGVLPFNASEPLDIALMHLNEPPPDPRDFRPDLSAAISEVLLTSLAKESDDRYQTGAALATALADAIQQTAVITQRTSMPSLSLPEMVKINLEAHAIQPPVMADTPKAATEPTSFEDKIGSAEATLPHSSPPTAPKAVTPNRPKTAPRPRMSQTIVKVEEQGFLQTYRMALVAGLVLIVLVVGGGFFLLNRTPDDALDVGLGTDDNTTLAATELVTTEVVPPTDMATEVLPPTEIPATEVPATEIIATEVVPTTEVILVSTSTPTGRIILLEVTAFDDSFLVIHNQSDAFALELSPLRFTNVPNGGENLNGIGGGFSILTLAPGDCVAYAKPNAFINPQDCTLVETVIVEEGRNRVWQRDYRILYQNGLNGLFITVCARDEPCGATVLVGDG